MDSRVVQSQAHEPDEHHHSRNVGSQGVTHGAENQHHHDHEKKSVLRKVKEKARKIKDTIKKHGHHDREHDHDYQYEDQLIHHDHDLNEEDDEQEEMAKASEVHGAPIYDSATTKSTTPGRVENQGQPRVNLENTAVMEEEHHQEPRIVVVTPTTESDQNRVTEPARTFVEQEEKSGQRTVNLERPMDLEEDPHAPGSRPEAYTPSSYETKVTDPTGKGTREIDIIPVQDSFARMNVQDEGKVNPEAKVLPTTSEMPSATKTQDLTPTIPKKLSENLQAEPKVLSSAAGTPNPSVGSHGQFLPDMCTSSNKTEYPSITSHDQFASESIPPNSYKFSENLQAEPEVLPVAADTQHPPVKSHGQVLPEMSTSAKTQYPSSPRHDQLASEPIPTISNETPTVLSSAADTQCPSVGSHDQFLPEKYTNNETLYPSAGSHDQFAPEFVPSELEENPQATGEILNTTTATGVAEQPYSESTKKLSNQNSYTEKILSATSAMADKAVSAKNAVGSKLGYEEKGDSEENETRHEEYRSEEKPSNQSIYTGKISNTTSAIADKAVSAKNALASELGYDDKGGREENETRYEEYKSEDKPSNHRSYTDKISLATSTIADKAASAKNVVPFKLGCEGDRDENQTRGEEYRSEENPTNLSSYTEKISNATSAKNALASKLGYDDEGDREESQTRLEEYIIGEKPSNQSSYTEEISSATSAIGDKAVPAKNTVPSKLDFDDKGDREETETRHEEYRSEEKPSNQSSYTDKISSATSAIADKAVSAKNVIASKFGYGEKDDINDRETTSEVHKSGDASTMTEPNAEYTQKIALSLTQELAPVYRNVAGSESAAMSKVPETGIHKSNGTTNETKSGVPVLDKGVSVKDYLAEKLRPGDEDRALKEVISETMHKRKEEPVKCSLVDEDRTVSEVVSDAIHKQEEPEKAEHEHLDKVSEESNVNSPRKGMVDKLKNVVGSWFGKPGDNQSSQVAGGEGYVGQGVEERTLQGSTK